MKNRLILLSSTFPYGSGEVFLKNEIPFLAKEFDELFLVPTKLGTNYPKEIPSFNAQNVILSESNKISWKFIFSFLFSRDFVREFSTFGFNSFKWKVFFKYLIQSSQLFETCKKLVIESDAPTVFYSYWADESAVALAHLKKKFGDKVVCVTRAHGWDLYYERHPKNYLPLRQFILQQLDGIYPISEMGKRYIESNWGKKPSNNVTVKRLGVGKRIISDKRNRDLIVSCSSLISLKRVELIIEALSQLNIDDIEWVHFGNGPEMQKLKTLAQDKISHLSYSFRGDVSNEEILEFYEKKAPRLFVNVSSTEGIPVSIMEAMSCGIPCLATNVGGTSEIVNSENGVLMKANPEIVEVCNSIRSLLSISEEEYTAYSQNAHKMWGKNYDSDVNFKEFSADLSSMLV